MFRLSPSFRRSAVMAVAGIAATIAASAAMACDCDDGGYYRPYYGYGYGNYSCHGGGYRCGRDGYYRHGYYRRYYDDDGYYRHRYYGYRRYHDCDDDCD